MSLVRMPRSVPVAAASATMSYDQVASRSAAVVIDCYSSSFGLATRLLAEPVRTHVRNVYGLVRVADELVDDPSLGLDPAQRDRALTGLERETGLALQSGYSSNLVVHAFATTARSVGFGAELVEPFFASMRSDLFVTRHDARSLDRYIYGSAEVVGLMCLRAFLSQGDGGAGYDELAHPARRLGAAFQKVNFLRDLAQDSWSLGRAYFPDVDPEHLTDADRDRLVADIESDLHASEVAIPLLPSSSRRAVTVAHALFAELVARLRSTPASRLVARRVRVPGPVKARIVLRTLAGEVGR